MICLLLCIAMVLGLKLELPVNARAEGDGGDSNIIPVGTKWYVGDYINLGISMPNTHIFPYPYTDPENHNSGIPREYEAILGKDM